MEKQVPTSMEEQLQQTAEGRFILRVKEALEGRTILQAHTSTELDGSGYTVAEGITLQLDNDTRVTISADYEDNDLHFEVLPREE